VAADCGYTADVDPGKAYALALIKKHAEEIAQAISIQLIRSVPALAAVDERARRHSIIRLLDALERTLTSNSPRPVLDHVRSVSQLRMASGMSLRSIIASGHVYMPVIRRVLVAKADDPLEGLRAYELIESHLLYLVVEGTMGLIPEEFPTLDDDEEEDTITDPTKKRYTLAPFSEYSDWPDR
jgi:hypothetical protein